MKPERGESLQGVVYTTESARTNSLAYKMDSFSESIADLTGSKAGQEKPLRIAAFLGTVVLITLLAEKVPDHQLAIYLSNIIGALGGAFAGDKLRPLSRLGTFNCEKFAKEMASGEPISTKKMAEFFAEFSDVLTEDEIRQKLLGRGPKPNQKPASDPRYTLIERLQEQYKKQNGAPQDKKERTSERNWVRTYIQDMQLLGQAKRGNPTEIRVDAIQRAANIALGALAGGISAGAINWRLENTGSGNSSGGLIGLSDDFLTLAFIVGSIFIKHSEVKSTGRSYGSLSRELPNQINHIRCPEIHENGRDIRAHVSRFGHRRT